MAARERSVKRAVNIKPAGEQCGVLAFSLRERQTRSLRASAMLQLPGRAHPFLPWNHVITWFRLMLNRAWAARCIEWE